MIAPDVVVLGAGLSGLSAAYALKATGRSVLVLDRRAHAGGRIHSERIGGFLMEHGPTSLAGAAPAAEGLIASVGLADARTEKGAGVRHRYLVREGRVRSLPLSPVGFFSDGFFSVAGRLRFLAEPLVSRRYEDEPIAAFVCRRFGREFLDYLFDPLVGGLYSGDPERLSVAALLPHLKRLEREYGSVVLGAALRRLSGKSQVMPGSRVLFSFRDGMGALPRALAAGLDESLLHGVRVERVRPAASGGFVVATKRAGERLFLRARSVVVALPAYGAAAVLDGVGAEAARALATIPHPPLAVVFLGFRAEDVAHPLAGLGYLAPRVENRPVLGTIFSSTLFPGRAPKGHIALTAFVGGARQPELARLPPTEMEALVAGETHALLGVRGTPVLARTRYWMRGLPQYEMGHAAKVETVRRLESAYPGLFVTGNYLAGMSTAVCVEQALLTARRADAYLAERRAEAHRAPARVVGCET
jgi:oxygen-dependent protoporphyrinogen oxidase